MDQIAHHADQVVMRKPLKRIRDARRHPKLESQVARPDSPLRPEICPGYPRSSLTHGLIDGSGNLGNCRRVGGLAGGAEGTIVPSTTDLLKSTT
jgi:hypothetical protein